MTILGDKIGEAENELTAPKCHNCFFAKFHDGDKSGICHNKIHETYHKAGFTSKIVYANDTCQGFRHKCYKYCDTCKFYHGKSFYSNQVGTGECHHKSHTGIMEDMDTMSFVYGTILTPTEETNCPYHQPKMLI